MAQPESKLSRAIQKAIRARGAFCFKVHGGPTMMTGLPDIIVCYRAVFIGMETKTPSGGDPDPRQVYVHGRIRKAEGIVVVPRSVRDALAALDDVDAWLDRGEGPYAEM